MPIVAYTDSNQDAALYGLARKMAYAMESGAAPMKTAFQNSSGRILFQKLGDVVRALVTVFRYIDYVGVRVLNPLEPSEVDVLDEFIPPPPPPPPTPPTAVGSYWYISNAVAYSTQYEAGGGLVVLRSMFLYSLTDNYGNWIHNFEEQWFQSPPFPPEEFTGPVGLAIAIAHVAEYEAAYGAKEQALLAAATAFDIETNALWAAYEAEELAYSLSLAAAGDAAATARAAVEAAYVAAAKKRQKQWVLEGLGYALELLKSGVMPPGWSTAIRLAAPKSAGTYAENAIKVSTSGGPSGGPSGGTYSRALRYTGYEDSPSGERRPVSRIALFSGSWTSDVMTIPPGGVLTENYSNWIYPGSYAAGAGAARPDAVFVGDDGESLGITYSGKNIYGYSRDSETEVGARIAPGPRTNQPTLIGLAPTPNEFIQQYREEMVVKYKADAGSTAWCDSAMVDGMIVGITPLALVENGAVIGMSQNLYPPEGERVFQLEFYGTAEFRYRFSDSSFSFRRWVPLLNSDGEVVLSARVNGNIADYNCLISYSGLKWPDTISASKAKAKLRSENKGDKVMHALLQQLYGRD